MPRNQRGQFTPGPDADRHHLTSGECSAGGRAAMRRYRNEYGDWIGPAWLWRRVRGWYRARKRRA